jgi:hypothetical protein
VQFALLANGQGYLNLRCFEFACSSAPWLVRNVLLQPSSADNGHEYDCLVGSCVLLACADAELEVVKVALQLALSALGQGYRTVLWSTTICLRSPEIAVNDALQP